MKVLAIYGSPHEDGGSTRVVREVVRGAKDAGHEVVEFYINKMNLQGCQACGACKRNNADCVLQDDLQDYWKHLHECGALIVSSPNYCGQVCGPMITYMNRHYCLMGTGGVRVHPGIKLVGVFAQGAPQIYEAADKNYDWFLSDFQYRGMELCAKLVHTGQMSEEKTNELMQQAYEVGKGLY